MILRRSATRALAVLGATALVGLALTGCSVGGGGGSSSDGNSISLLAGGNDPLATKTAKDIAAAFMKKYPSIKVKVDTRPGGTDGDNLIKTRLSTKTMDDVFFYNSGSLLQALHPDQTLQPLGNEPWAASVSKDFKAAVSTSKGMYGAPFGSTFDGGVMYNKKVYAKLGLSVPDTWAEFISNSQKIKAAGIVPVVQSYGDTWTSQLFVLADFANVSAQDPNWAANYTANKAKYVNPPALAGFQDTEEVHKLGLLNKDFASLTNVNALKMLATGQAAQYPMITVVIGNVIQSNPDQVNDIGYFAMPTANGNSHATVWEANGAYIPLSTTGAKLASAKKLVAFLNSPEGCAVQNAAQLPAGPYATTACTVPSNAPALVADEQKYQDAGKTGLALEFISPIKGPNLEKILIQVGSGISTAAQGAALYDQDVKAQAQQLGLPGWN
ncbi:ABC transporter substrate-binding protein [Galbitalea soli]|uniref:Extracellular solute-binding protein n=1 Tax=Galbitalea soli TaxID=1268042 RepID=A0A7C9PPQ3_9MICO|nr:extracellular solute-binding protein [Galbitalea soli]NEM92512.1 extracellular solute-binding protein [Galbitalea soli]NYJ29549.1 raffinose/stachyose/melibiose transport system substrate-binding protein [Galbitalea soli]